MDYPEDEALIELQKDGWVRCEIAPGGFGSYTFITTEGVKLTLHFTERGDGRYWERED